MAKLIITVIASAEKKIYVSFLKEYWFYYIKYLNTNTDIKVFLLFSSDTKNQPTLDNLLTSEIKDSIRVYDVNEDGRVGQPGCLLKTILCFKEILENETFDFVLRTNLSTVFLPDRLLQFVNQYNASEKIVLGNITKNCTWGGGYILSKPLLIEFLKHTDKLNSYRLGCPDDVTSASILKYCRPYNIIKKNPFKMETYGKGDKKLWDTQINDLYNDIIENKDIIYIRVKNGANRNFDLAFHKYFIKNYLI